MDSKPLQVQKSENILPKPFNSCEIQGNSENSSGQSLTMLIGEEALRRNNQNNLEEEEVKKIYTENNVVEVEVQEVKISPIKTISKEKAEEICVKWIKSLNKIETGINIDSEVNQFDQMMSGFCSNRICPISNNKIQKTPKVIKQMKKVVLRKVHLENEYVDDERWYCLKCLTAHNHSLSCLYC